MAVPDAGQTHPGRAQALKEDTRPTSHPSLPRPTFSPRRPHIAPRRAMTTPRPSLAHHPSPRCSLCRSGARAHRQHRHWAPIYDTRPDRAASWGCSAAAASDGQPSARRGPRGEFPQRTCRSNCFPARPPRLCELSTPVQQPRRSGARAARVGGGGRRAQAVRRIRWTPLSVETTDETSPTRSRNVASSNGFCIWPRVKKPRSPAAEWDEQSDWVDAGGGGHGRRRRVMRRGGFGDGRGTSSEGRGSDNHGQPRAAGANQGPGHARRRTERGELRQVLLDRLLELLQDRDGLLLGARDGGLKRREGAGPATEAAGGCARSARRPKLSRRMAIPFQRRRAPRRGR